MQLDSRTRCLAARRAVAIIVSAIAMLPVWAGATETWHEDFDTSPVNASLATWVDSRLGAAAPDAKGIFRVGADPLDATNHVYGTDAAGPIRLHGVRQGGIPRVGFVSTLVSPTLETGGTISGRILLDREEARGGFTLLSGLPNRDAFLLLALSPQPDSDGATLRAFAWDSTRGGEVTSALEGELQHDVTIDSETWLRFRIRVDRAPGASTVLARVWPENEDEPDAWQIRAIDSRREGLDAVRFGLWSAGRGGAWIDDLAIESEGVTDVRAPSIAIFESGNPFPDGFAFNRDVRPDIRVDDDDPAPVVIAELNGEAFSVAGVVSAEGPHELRVEVIDRAGNRANASVHFSVDKTPPGLALTSHANGSLLTNALPTLSGTSGDAVEVTVGGRPAVVDAGAGTWTLPAYPLLEGTNALAIAGRDRAGNVSSITPVLVLDSRGPDLVVRSPAPGFCTNASSILLEGGAPDTHVAGVVVRDALSGIEVLATLDRETGSWSAALPVAEAGAHELTITATDEAGHSSNAVLTVRVDRERPVIEVTEGGAAFARSFVNRALALFVRATDADSGVVVEATLDGEPYLSGSNVAGEGSHTLVVTARDCAGNEDSKTIVFTIDVTAPVIGALAPANDAEVGEMPDRITGTVTDNLSEVGSVELAGAGLTVTPANSAFTLSGVPFAEGTNRFTLRARDVAGNEATLDYVVTVRTEAPTVTISENGTPIASGALFNRDLTPEIVSSDPEASITATLGGAAYVPGTAITSEGTHTLVATATNALGKAGSKTVQFTIDKSGPAVAITSPANGASIATDVVTVTGTATGATSVLVNGTTATLSGTTFSANVALDLGENVITAVARDEAGNAARADVTVTRAGSGPAIVLLHPPDKSLTNRPKTEVLGRVISPANVTEVEISPLPLGEGPGVRVTPNAAGDFRLSDVQLTEGNNTITATAIGTDGKTTSVTISLTGDFTAPTLAILANGAALDEGARFPESPGLKLEAGDNATAEPVTTLLLDGGVLPAVIANGGHLVVATATDGAGNTTRLERTFFVGDAGTGTTGCSVTNLDPASGSIITSTVTRLAGRTSAPAVRINGVATEVVDGSFCTTVELPAEGANPIEIVCTTLAGEPIGDPVALALIRSTGQPSVTITSPAEGQVFTPAASGTATKITVTGEAGPGVISVSVNGIVRSLDGTDLGTTRAFSVVDVPLAGGLNILAVRGETAAKRAALATSRVVLLEGAPRIAITSSIGSVPTGATSVDVSGTWANLDPATLAVTGGAAVSHSELSDTHGTFVANVPLAIGSNTISVTGGFAGLAAETATVTVTREAGAPWVAIATPDNTVTAADSIEITGTFSGDPGARVEIMGVAATLSGNTFSAPVTLSTVPGAPNPIVARVIEPDGGVSVDTILVTRFAGTFDVEETFPAPGSAQIPVTFQLLVRLSHDVDHSTVAGSIRLENAAGQPVSGILRTDRDVVTFAPSAPLGAGETYTLRVTTGLRDLAGRALGTDYVATFTTEPGPATSAPELAVLPQVFCGETLPVTGTAPSGARIRLDTAGLQFFTNANATGAFRFDVPVIGAEGYRLVRVRIVGTDGSMSEAAESCLRIECGGPQVVSAEYDRTVNSLTITFNRDIDPATIVMGSSVLLDRAGLPVSGTVSQSSGTTFVVTPSEDLTESSFRLTVTTGVEDTSGNALRFPFTESFTLGGAPIDVPPGHGYITGEVYDATTGRPLQGASVSVAPSGAPTGGAPTSPSAGPPASTPALTDARGRYAMALPEGAHTIEVTAPGHTTVWRQVVVPAGTGVVPIDIRLTTHGVSAAIASTDLTLQHGGETPVTTPVTLSIPSGSLTAGSTVTLTSVGTQSLAGLLPLGWSPLASVEVVATDASAGLGARASSPASARTNVSSSPRPATAGSTAPVSSRPATAGRGAGGEGLSGNLTTTPITATLTFTVPGAAITAATQTLTAVRYDATRDEWHVLDAAVNVTGDTATINLTSDGAYALVYPDKGPGLTTPPTPSGGTALVGITDPCATPNACGDLTKELFTLDPPVVLPDQRTTATLRVNSTLNTQHSTFPSGTAVQAYIDEELQLADGSTITDPPFATDLLLYRGLDGGAGEARFHLAPSKRAAEVILQVGYEHIRIHPYPGRLDRGTLIGNEGGRVPGDGTVSIDIPEGAALEPVHAEVAQADVSGLTLEGYTVLGGFDFTLARAGSTPPQDLDGDGQPDPIAPVQLFKPASMTYVVDRTELPAAAAQVLLAEVLSGENAGIIRLTALMSDAASAAKTAPQSGRSFQLRPYEATSRTAPSSRTASPNAQPAEVENFGHNALLSPRPATAGRGAGGEGQNLTAETAIRYTTQLPTTALPIDGLTREGRYLVLAADNPVAYATGLVRLGSPTGPIAASAQVTTSPLPLGEGPGVRVLGVADLVRPTGIYAIPVPAAGFALTPSSRTFGKGTPYENAAAVATGSIHNIPLVLTAQPPSFTLTEPATTTEVSLSTRITVQSDKYLDPASFGVAPIVVTNALTGEHVPGTITQYAQQTLSITFTPTNQLQPNARYTVAVAPTVRTTNQTPLGRTVEFSFATVTAFLPPDGAIDREKISITIPDEKGASLVRGRAGAIHQGWTVTATRRLRDFTTVYTTKVESPDGSFDLPVGDCDNPSLTAPCADAISIHDTIDLHVVNTSGILTAVIRLTPFVTSDGNGFIAPPDRETRFTSEEDITLIVPAGAFDEPTLVTVEKRSAEVFSGVPTLAERVKLYGVVDVRFEGVANKRLDVEMPVPVDFVDGDSEIVVGRLGNSLRGPKVMVVDTVRVEDGKFKSSSSADTSKAAKTGQRSAIITNPEVKKKLMGVRLPGPLSVFVHLSPIVWYNLEAYENIELFFKSVEYMYLDRIYIESAGGKVTFPVERDRGFTVVGVDSSTGLETLSRPFDAPVVSDPSLPINLPTLNPDRAGPYPLYATPFKVEVIDLNSESMTTPELKFSLNGGVVAVSNNGSKVAANVTVQLMNSSNGAASNVVRTDATGSFKATLPAAFRDRIVVIFGKAEIDPDSVISIVLSEKLYLGLPAVEPLSPEDAYNVYLKGKIKLERFGLPLPVTSESSTSDLTSQVRFVVDSNERRITLGLRSSVLPAGQYRLTISKDLIDVAGNALGTVLLPDPDNPNGDPRAQGGGKDLVVEFRVREPKGELTSFEFKPSDLFTGGGLRDMARYGNLTFISALDGGILAFDMSDPAQLNGTVKPLSFVPGKWRSDPDDPTSPYATGGFDQHWAIASDHHGRIYSTGLTPLFGALRSYRVEDFLAAAEPGARVCDDFASTAPVNSVCKFHGAAVVSWRLGAESGMALSSDLISDRPEATPRELQLLVQDDASATIPYQSPTAFASGVTTNPGLDYATRIVSATAPKIYDGGFEEFDVTVSYDPRTDVPHYLTRRMTVENTSLDMRWSIDVPAGGTAVIEDVIARRDDNLRLVANTATYGVIALFGHGVSVFDLNAVESNDVAERPSTYEPLREQLTLTNGQRGDRCGGPELPSIAIDKLTLTADVALNTFPNSSRLQVLAIETTSGLVDLTFEAGTQEADLCPDRGASVVFKNRDQGYVHPKLSYIDTKFGSRTPFARFSGTDRFRWQIARGANVAGERGSEPDTDVARDYLLVPGGDYGLLIVEIGGQPGPAINSTYAPLTDRHLVDVIWFPAGAVSVRVIPGTEIAAVVDKKGRLNLVDLSRIDERWNSRGEEIPPDALFESARKAIDATPAEPDEVGVDDARILWKSEPGFVKGSVPPLIDAETGLALSGDALTNKMKLSSVIDPRLRVISWGGSSREIGSIIPLGVDPRSPAAPEAGVFRLEMALPGSVTDSLPDGQLRIAVESEIVPGSPTPQTPDTLPRAHLRNATRDGVADQRPGALVMNRRIPRSSDPEVSAALVKKLKHQKGFNRFESPWVIAVADPRASIRYEWPGGATSAQKRAAGCMSCERPTLLMEKTEDDGFFELWTSGRSILLRPDTAGSSPFAGSLFDYLGEAGRFETRVGTIPADTVRPSNLAVAAQNPPVADGDFQETTYLHSGEIATMLVDLAVEGRGGFDLGVARTYRSRVLGSSLLGQGWDSSLFRRLRLLPDGNVEYRDGTGEVWTFKPLAEDSFDSISVADILLGTTIRYESPAGLFLKLARNANGYVLFDQQWRMMSFDNLGRLVSESDEFFDPSRDLTGIATGNFIRYLYDDTGRLARVKDPVGRETTISYWTESEAAGNPRAYAGMLKEVLDWRGRSVRYEYDANGRGLLTRVLLPETSGPTSATTHTGEKRPAVNYTYFDVSGPSPDVQGASIEYTNYLEYVGNLTQIKDPTESAKGESGKPRVVFAYEEPDVQATWQRDRVFAQGWATGETATITAETFDGTMVRRVSTEDAMKQKRIYELGVADDMRVHVTKLTLPQLDVFGEDWLNDPGVADPGEASKPWLNVSRTFEYDQYGLYRKVHRNDGSLIKYVYAPANGGAPGALLYAMNDRGVETDFEYGEGRGSNTPKLIKRGRLEDPASFQEREIETPHAENLVVESTDVDIKTSLEYNPFGQIVTRSTLDAAGGDATRVTVVTYKSDDSANLVERGRVGTTRRGDGVLQTSYAYSTTASGGLKSVEEDAKRGTITETIYDAMGRVTSAIVKDSSGILSEETFGYNADGQMVRKERRQKGLGTVVTTFSHDLMGRVIETTMSNADVDGTLQTVSSRSEYDPANRLTVDYDPTVGGSPARVETRTDGLGRVTSIKRVSSDHTLSLEQRYGYNLNGELAYESDGKYAIARVFDGRGFLKLAVDSDGLATSYTFDIWDQLVRVRQMSRKSDEGARSEISDAKSVYTRLGRLRQTSEEIEDGGVARATRFGWDEGGRRVGSRVGEVASIDALSPVGAWRAEERILDSARRVLEERIGEVDGISDPIASTSMFQKRTFAYQGDVPRETSTEEPLATSLPYKAITDVDGLNRPRSVVEAGTYRTTMEYDEIGNVVSILQPGFDAPSRASYDSRGLPRVSTLASGETVTRSYDALGVLRGYRDEAGSETTYSTDGLGRVTKATYPDQTTEEVRFENGTGRVVATRDRAGQWLRLEYDAGGRITAVYGAGSDDEPAADGDPVRRYTYDDGGRLTRLANADAAVEYAEFDGLGRPRVTRTIRYKKIEVDGVERGSGLEDAPEILDVHTQGHTWSVFDGERSRWRMPAAGTTLPEVEPETSWRSWIGETWDAGGNLVEQRAVASASGPDAGGIRITRADGRGLGRVDSRERALSRETPVRQEYEYADGIDRPGEAASGLLAGMESALGETPLSGGRVARDDGKRVTGAQDAGLGNRRSEWSYDRETGRVEVTTLAALTGGAASTPLSDEGYVEPDFRTFRHTTGRLTDAQRETLGDEIRIIEPASWEAATGEAHRIGLLTRSWSETLTELRTFAYEGGRRTSDGAWTSSYDTEGRRISVENGDRRIEYVYDPSDRLVGRTAYRNTGGDWVVETRTDVLRKDGLPAASTFVWDPFADRLLAVFVAGQSVSTNGAPVTPDIGLVRQYVHGGQAYDDPVEFLSTADTSVASGPVVRRIPLVDEAATGSLQATLTEDGSLVERVLYADAYGDAPRYLQGPVVDRIEIEATKRGDETLESVEVRVHLSELIRASSLTGGAELLVVEGSATRPSPVPAAVDDGDKYTVTWTLTGTQWAAMAGDGSGTLEIVVTDALRGAAWGDAEVMAVPGWLAKIASVTAEPGRPVIRRERLEAMASFIESVPPGKSKTSRLFELPDLYLVAAKESRVKMLTDFHALPFREPVDGTIYARARWYDASTGTFLTPDPLGYEDSSNLYAFAQGDPVNRRDPLGTTSSWQDWKDENWEDYGTLPEEDRRNFRRYVSAAFGTAPVVGEGLDALQLVTGYDFIAGEALTPGDRAVVLAATLVPFASATAVRQGVNLTADAVRVERNLLETAAQTPKKYTVAELRRMIDEDLSAGFTKSEAIERIRAGKKCFVAGTLVHTRDGLKPIETIKEGDIVLSRNMETGQLEWQPVVQTFVREANEIVWISVEGEPNPIGATPEHPFWVRRARDSSGDYDDGVDDGVWVASEQLREGDLVLSATVSWIPVREASRGPAATKVYNFEVAGNHNYYVGRVGQLVHNSCDPSGDLELQRGLAQLVTSTRDEMVRDFSLLLKNLKPGEFRAIKRRPWTMRLFFGTALERRVADLAEEDQLLSVLFHTPNNAPQDFIAPSNLRFDITGSSRTSIMEHYARPEVDVVVTYESIPGDLGTRFARWLK